MHNTYRVKTLPYPNLYILSKTKMYNTSVCQGFKLATLWIQSQFLCNKITLYFLLVLHNQSLALVPDKWWGLSPILHYAAP